MKSEIYINRHNYKLFDSTIPVSPEIEEHIDTVIQHTPMQEPHDKFCILKLKHTEQDIKIKEFYLTRIFRNIYNNHMTAMLTAPLVYLGVYKHDYEKAEVMSMEIHAGTVLSETLNAGLDISIIGCTQEISKKDLHKSEKILKERFNDFNVDRYKAFPSICFCIGKGINPLGPRLQMYKLSNGIEVSYINSFNQKKPNILLT